MAWIDRPSGQLYTMFKPDRPLIDIPQARHSHREPLRTPEDAPLRVPWISAGDEYHIATFDDEHNRFPDVEDANWAMGMVSPPSPSRRSSLELLPDASPGLSPHYADEIQDSDWAMGMASPASPSRRNSLELPPDTDYDAIDDPPMLSPPSPCVRTLTGLPEESNWPPPDFDCPQLSPPSPTHRSTILPSLEFDRHSLFVEDAQPPFVEPAELSQASFLGSRLHMEHRALLSLRDRTMNAERTSRARNKALRGRERELGWAVSMLRATTATSDPTPDAVKTLHTYRTAATHVMLERTEEKRRRKKDKERLKELRVLLGTGVDALLSTDGAQCPDATMDLGMGLAPAAAPCGLGLALHAPPPAEDHAHALAERTHVMRRLVACMTMRRRDLGMRSLIEAGNMADGVDEVPARASCRRSGLAGPVLLPDAGDPGGYVKDLNLCAEKGGEWDV